MSASTRWMVATGAPDSHGANRARAPPWFRRHLQAENQAPRTITAYTEAAERLHEFLAASGIAHRHRLDHARAHRVVHRRPARPARAASAYWTGAPRGARQDGIGIPNRHHVPGTIAGVSEGRDWATVFNQTFARDASAVEERIWHEVMGEEYPAGLDTFSWLSRTELDRITTEVRIQPDDTLADLGCGRVGRGPGRDRSRHPRDAGDGGAHDPESIDGCSAELISAQR
jgi:hypothetical protein